MASTLKGTRSGLTRGYAGDDKGKSGKKRATLYMVTPYMDHDLSGMLTNPDIRFTDAQVKCYMLQLLEGLRYLHDVGGTLEWSLAAIMLMLNSRISCIVT